MSTVELSPVTAVVHVESRPELSRWVKSTLCRHDHLDPEQFKMQEIPLVRGGEPCGTLFQLQGPRAVTLRAIWSRDDGRVLFYDSAGTRFLATSCVIAPAGER